MEGALLDGAGAPPRLSLPNISRKSGPMRSWGSTSSPSGASFPSMCELLERLSDHSRARRGKERSMRLFLRDFQTSIAVACWTLFLALPVIVWPLANYLWNFGCHEYSFLECRAHPNCYFNPSPSWQPWVGQCVAKKSGYLQFWGAMILQFLFSIHCNLGSTVLLTVQGLFGTLLAYLNVQLLDVIMAGLFGTGGGAYSAKFMVKGLTNSAWLPLCNDGFHIFSGPDDNCFLNIWWTHLTVWGSVQLLAVMLDFVVFLFVCIAVEIDPKARLAAVVNSNTRIFALSTHVYFMMSYLNPATDDFQHRPSTAFHYVVMIVCASVVAIMCFLFPRRRFTAWEMAEELAQDAVGAVGCLLESMHLTGATLVHQKAKSALAETEVVLSELDVCLETSRFEDFAWFLRVRAHNRERKRLLCFAGCLRDSIRHLRDVYGAAAALPPEDAEFLEQHAAALGRPGLAAKELLARSFASPPSSGAAAGGPSWAQSSAEFLGQPAGRSSRVGCFLFLLYGVISDTHKAIDQFAQEERSIVSTAAFSARQCCGQLRLHFKSTRFVVLYTVSICTAFVLGWFGLWNILPAYGSTPASTICLVMYAHTSPSAPVTIRRVSGVVLGKVIGTVAQLAFAVEVWWRACCYAASLWLMVAVLFFQYLHLNRDLASVCCLAVAYGASTMIPGNCKFRLHDNETNNQEVAPAVFTAIVSTVLGVGIMAVFDSCFQSSATRYAQQRLLRAVSRARRCMCSGTFGFQEGWVDKFLSDLDKLRNILPYAEAEPRTLVPFKAELFHGIEKSLRAIFHHIDTIGWATEGSSMYTSPEPAGPAAGLSRADLQPLFAAFRRVVFARLSRVEELAGAVVQNTTTGDWNLIRSRLVANLYTAKAVHLISQGNRAVRNLVLSPKPGGRDPAPGDAASQASEGSFLKSFSPALDRLMRGELDKDVWGAVPQEFEGEADEHTLERLLQSLREKADARPGAPPPHDDSSCVDVCEHLIWGVLLEIQGMELMLLEY